MGRAKDLMMQEEEQGWGFSDNHICSRCITDAYLKAFIKNSATYDAPCTFCGRRPSVELDDVMEIIGNTVTDYYNRAVNEAPSDGAEGGYRCAWFLLTMRTSKGQPPAHGYDPLCRIVSTG